MRRDGRKGHLDFDIMPPAPDKCQECAVAHDPHAPHNAESLFYQYRFYDQTGRWPTWTDAMSHCDPETQERWKTVLREKGVEV
jgi:hypothetical protein